MVEVIVSRLGLDSASNSFVVLLKEKDGQRMLPIWIGRVEAEAIAAYLNGVRRERPMTHDLVTAIIVSLGGTLRRVQVTRVEENTFFAEMHLVVSGTPTVIDARPSDCIAVALRLEAPIFAADELLALYSTPGEPADDGDDDGPEPPGPADDGVPGTASAFDVGAAHDELAKSAAQLQRHLEQLRPEDFGKFSP